MLDKQVAAIKMAAIGWFMYFSELWYGLIDKIKSKNDDDDWPHGNFAV